MDRSSEPDSHEQFLKQRKLQDENSAYFPNFQMDAIDRTSASRNTFFFSQTFIMDLI